MFVSEKNLRELVLSYLRRQESSISGVARQLQKDGYRLHRLFLTGYLRALADMGMLKEKEIPPSKVYTLAAYRERNMYEAVGERCRALEPEEDKAQLLALAVLQRLFRRPIFLREIKECGFSGGPEACEVGAPARDDARRALAKVGIPLPTNEPAYVLNGDAPEARDQVIADVLLDRFAVSKLVVETRQVKLPVGSQASTPSP